LGKVFFDIPVYRLSENKYNEQIEVHIRNQMYGKTDDEQEMRKKFYERNVDNKMNDENRLWKEYGGAWQFNEIIGYIRLYIDGNQVLGEYWETEAKRKVRTRRKLFIYSTYKVVPERDLPLKGDSLDIYKEILNYLRDANDYLKGRFVDTSVFEKIGHYIDWSEFVKNT